MHISKYSPKFFAQQKIDSYQSAQVVVPLFLNLFPSKSEKIMAPLLEPTDKNQFSGAIIFEPFP